VTCHALPQGSGFESLPRSKSKLTKPSSFADSLISHGVGIGSRDDRRCALALVDHKARKVDMFNSHWLARAQHPTSAWRGGEYNEMSRASFAMIDGGVPIGCPYAIPDWKVNPANPAERLSVCRVAAPTDVPSHSECDKLVVLENKERLRDREYGVVGVPCHRLCDCVTIASVELGGTCTARIPASMFQGLAT